VIKEWGSLNDQISEAADHFARAGYNAFVLALYPGRLTTAVRRGQ